MLPRFKGPGTLLGIVVALFSVVLDQALKLWALNSLGIQEGETYPIAPSFDFTLVWNRGISYGLWQQYSQIGRWGLIAFRFAAVIFLLTWLARTPTRLGAIALGLIIGGAIGNGIDGIAYGAVADFFYFHIGSFDWYVFNIADIAIVAGVALLLYEAVMGTGQPGDAA